MSVIYVYIPNKVLPCITIDHNNLLTRYSNKIIDMIEHLWFLTLIKDLKVTVTKNIKDIITLKHNYTKFSKIPCFCFQINRQ
jgi:hypothetical protein